MIKKTIRIIPVMIAGGIGISSLFFTFGIAYAETGDTESVEVPGETDNVTSDVNAADIQSDTEPVEGAPEESDSTADGDISESSADNDASSVFGNSYIDINSDGKTDEEDKNELRKIIDDYKMPDHNNQEVSGELSRIIYGPLTSPDKEMPETPSSYFLSNEGQLTTAKDQGDFGTCWAFAAVSALESSVLKERQKLNPQDDTPVSYETPVLEGLNKDIDISEKYLSWMIYHNADMGEGTQNEGVTTGIEGQNVLFIGGLSGFADAAWTSWRGVVNETDEPYKADNYSDDYTDDMISGTGSDGLPLRWSVSDKSYDTGDPDAPVRVDTVLTLPVTSVIEYKDGKNVWTGYDAGAASMIKQALMDNGGVMISYEIDMSMVHESGNKDYLNKTYWSQYNDSDTFGINHAVTIVGWDDSYPAENFKADKNELPPGDGAWLVKNSWGSDEYYKDRYGESYEEVVDSTSEKLRDDIAWGIPGENGVGTGFFWLSYYDKSINSAMAFGVDIPDDGWDHDNIYQYDYYAELANYPLILRMYDDDTSVANVFSAKGDEVLKAVSVRTVENNARVNVKVYLIDGDEVTDPTAGTLVSEETAELPIAGFTTLSLSKPVELKSGQRFAVVETVTAASGDLEAVSFLNVETVLNPELQKDKNMSSVRETVISNAGESFAKILTGGGYTWVDSVALTNELGEGIFSFGNALIKAFTVDIKEQQHYTGDKGDPGGQDGDDDKDREDDPGKQDDPFEKGDIPEEKVISDGRNETEEKDDIREDKNDHGVKVPVSSSVKKAAAAAASPVSAVHVTAAKTGERDFSFVWAAVAVAAAGVPVVYTIVRRKNTVRG